MIDTAVTVALVLVVLVAFAWYLSYQAARLDRLHAKVEGAMSVLDASCVRRAEAGLELANSGALEPATALLVADAAAEALERQTEHVGDDLLEGHSFGGREDVESDLSQALRVALSEDVVAGLRDEDDEPEARALDRVAAAWLRVQLARRFHNEAVREATRVREKVLVRAFRLAGHASMPQRVDFDDELPPALTT